MRYIVCGVVVTGHRRCGGPREVIVQHASEALVAVETRILEGLIETGDCPLVHLLVRAVAAVNLNDGSLVTELVRIGRWSTECFRPVRGKSLGVLWVESVAERMADHLILQHPHVPRMGQPQQSIKTSRGFVNSLHGFRVHSRILWHFNKGRSLKIMDLALVKAKLQEAGVVCEHGLTEDEIQLVEHSFGFQFTPDLRAFLMYVLPSGKRWPNWRDVKDPHRVDVELAL